MLHDTLRAFDAIGAALAGAATGPRMVPGADVPTPH
jgi:hypothetical protein